MCATRIKKTARKQAKRPNPTQLGEIRDDLLMQRQVLHDLLADLNEHAILLRADKDGLLSLAGLARFNTGYDSMGLPQQQPDDDDQYLREMVESMIMPDLNLATHSSVGQCESCERARVSTP